MTSPQLPYATRAEVRGVEEGHKTWKVGDHHYEVVSESQEGVRHTVRYSGRRPGAWIVFACSCPAGKHANSRREGSARLVPCKHAALVGRRLEREGEAVWDDRFNFWTCPGTMDEATRADVFDTLHVMRSN